MNKNLTIKPKKLIVTRESLRRIDLTRSVLADVQGGGAMSRVSVESFDSFTSNPPTSVSSGATSG